MIYCTALIITGLLLFCYSGLILFLRDGYSKLLSDPDSDLSPVSIVIPAHNEEKNILNLLKKLTLQNYPTNLTEIILVDDRSTDQTPKIIKDFVNQFSHVRWIQIKDKLLRTSPKKRAIAKAIRRASNDIIITTDADTSPGSDWIRSIVSAYRENTGMVLGYAPYRTDGPFNTLFHRILALEYFGLGAVTAASTGKGIPLTCNGANMSYRKSIYEKVGGFGETLQWISGDDDLLLHRFRDKGNVEIRYTANPKAAVFNNPPENFLRLIQQRIRFSSKHLAYPPKILRILLCIYLFHAALLGWLIGSLFSMVCLIPFITGLTGKIIFELLLLIPAQKLLEKRNLLKYYPLVVLPHIFYVVIIPILGQVMPKRW
jgi:cellulose synthase/poly-beta-1,6-N-acetylglucosamine synthase-like glycosyltransferase